MALCVTVAMLVPPFLIGFWMGRRAGERELRSRIRGR
jgi:hypothetical protein